MTALEVRHDAAAGRYELIADGEQIGLIDYRPAGDALAFVHTEIVPRLRGRGLGARLVAGALDDVRRRGQRVVPVCLFVADFLDRSPEYADLRAGPQYSTRSR